MTNVIKQCNLIIVFILLGNVVQVSLDVLRLRTVCGSPSIGEKDDSGRVITELS